MLTHGCGIEGVRELPHKSFDMLLTDPPYSVGYYKPSGKVTTYNPDDGKRYSVKFADYWDEDDLQPDWLAETLDKIRGWAVVFCGQEQLASYLDIMKDCGMVSVMPGVWHKTNPLPANMKHAPIRATELMAMGKFPGTEFHNKGQAIHNVFEFPNETGNRIHKTQKPVALLEHLIGLLSPPSGGSVLDPFAGSASTGVASLRQGRRCRMFERDVTIFEVASARLVAENLRYS